MTKVIVVVQWFLTQCPKYHSTPRALSFLIQKISLCESSHEIKIDVQCFSHIDLCPYFTFRIKPNNVKNVFCP